MMQEVGYCSGIENYSRHMSNRKPGEPPFTLLDYFPVSRLVPAMSAITRTAISTA